MSELRERVAWALADCEPYAVGQQADAALSAIREAGYEIVPREPTKTMLIAGGQHIAIAPTGTARLVWAAMLSAHQDKENAR